MGTTKVIVGIGVPGCGKTTYLKPLAERIGIEYINPDDIRQELTGDASNHSHEEQVWSAVHSRVIGALKRNGAVVDATYTKVKDRRQLIELCRKNGANEIIAYWFKLPLSLCLERNSKRQRIVPESAIVRMHNRLALHPPELHEGFDQIIEINQ
jgi:predicted kinase